MLRLLASLTLSVLANGVGLFVASLVFDDFSVSATGFITATLLFSIATTVLGPLITKIALTNASFLMGGIALITTFVGLLVTSFFIDSFIITGIGTWIGVVVIVWLSSVVAQLVLPLFLFKKILQNNRNPQ